MKNIFIYTLAVIISLIFTFTFIKVKESNNIDFKHAYNGSLNIKNAYTNIVNAESDDAFYLSDIDSPTIVPPILNSVSKDIVSSNWISIIIDDTGNTLNNIDRFFNVAEEYEITFAVLPDSRYSIEFSSMAYSNSINTILHMPMQGSSYFGEQTLIVTDMNKDEVFKLLNYSFSRVPYARGLNNHTGSIASKDHDIVSYMLEYAKNNNKFFIDSYTVAGSLIYDMALDYDVKTAKRSVFLDNYRSYDAIMKQWNELIKLSKKHGGAIAIGHYQSIETLRVLENNLPLLMDEGIVSINVNKILN